MTIFGDPSSWRAAFPDTLIPRILDMVCEVWVTLQKPAPDDLETPMTLRLCAALMQSPQLQALPLRVDPEVSLLSPSGALVGRLDIRFTSASVATGQYFSFECKRLYARKGKRVKALAAEYVNDGMMRYVTGQYSPERNQAGMIAYVLTGTVADALKTVCRSITRHKKLNLLPPKDMRPSTLRPTDVAARETHHLRAGSNFVIHHLFLS